MSAAYIEFKDDQALVLAGERGADFPIARDAAGKITPDSARALALGLRGLLGGTVERVHCSIPARGVSLRKISLPAAAAQDAGKLLGLLALQAETQFPAALSELAWGWQRLPGSPGGNGGAAPAEYLLAAVRRDILDDYSAVLAQAGLNAVFTVAALARAGTDGFGPMPASLELGRTKSELLLDSAQGPALRALPWGVDNLPDADALTRSFPSEIQGKVLLSGAQPGLDRAARLFSDRRPSPLACEVAPVPAGPGITAANLGWKNLAARRSAPLLLGDVSSAAPVPAVASSAWQWAALALLLLAACAALRYAEALIFRASLQEKLAALKQYRSTLPQIDRELGFLQYIKTNQPPHLDTIAVIAQSAPPGLRLESLSVTRRGDVALKGSVNDPQAPENFRAKLIASGFFGRVVVEEQSPGQQDRNRINFRVAAQLKPEDSRPHLPPEPPASLTNAPNAAPAFPMGQPGGRPRGMPQGLPSGSTPGFIPPS